MPHQSQMKTRITRRLRRLTTNPVMELEQKYGLLSFSQEGEDMVLKRFFEAPPVPNPGFYVDVGAHHPMRFSNTYYFYRRGWRGINIDAMPGSMGEFDRLRPRDINIEIGVAEKATELEYHIFNEPALNGFSPELSRQRDGLRDYRLLETRIVPVKPLREILETHLPTGQPIDFLSVDVEGLDMAVLRSNDWNRFRPRFLVTEALGGDNLETLRTSETVRFLADHDYCLRSRTTSSCFFEDQRHCG